MNTIELENQNFTFRKLNKSELPEAVELILRVFDEFEAPEYSAEGVQTFHNLMTDQKFFMEFQIPLNKTSYHS